MKNLNKDEKIPEKKKLQLPAKVTQVKVDNGTCPICMEYMAIMVPNCGHPLCSNCLYDWVENQEKTSCATCHSEFTSVTRLFI